MMVKLLLSALFFLLYGALTSTLPFWQAMLALWVGSIGAILFNQAWDDLEKRWTFR